MTETLKPLEHILGRRPLCKCQSCKFQQIPVYNQNHPIRQMPGFRQIIDNNDRSCQFGTTHDDLCQHKNTNTPLYDQRKTPPAINRKRKNEHQLPTAEHYPQNAGIRVRRRQ